MPSKISSWGQVERAKYISLSNVLSGQDIILLQECFHHEAREQVVLYYRNEYPYHTEVLGRFKSKNWDSVSGSFRSLRPVNGGVMIMSKWPILRTHQHIFDAKGCGADNWSRKGFVYAALLMDNQKIHVVNTHLQAETPACKDNGVSARIQQLNEIRMFLDSMKIPPNEMIVIGGDMNIHKHSFEYYNMLKILNVQEPMFAGHSSTFDTQSNGIAQVNYPEENPSYLDYIFVEKDHKSPTYWHNQAIDPQSRDKWIYKKKNGFDFSDHFPVRAFAYADSTTQIRSFKNGREYKLAKFLNFKQEFIQRDTTKKQLFVFRKRSNEWKENNEKSLLPKTNFVSKLVLRVEELFVLKTNHPDGTNLFKKHRIRSGKNKMKKWITGIQFDTLNSQ